MTARPGGLGFVARLVGPPRAALSWLAPLLVRLETLTVPRGLVVLGTRAMRLAALRRTPERLVLLELSGALEPGVRALVPVEVEGVATAVEPPAIDPPGLIPAAEVPPVEPVEEGGETSITAPTAGVGEAGLATAGAPGPGIDVAAPTAGAVATLGPFVALGAPGPGAIAGVAALGLGVGITEFMVAPGPGAIAGVAALGLGVDIPELVVAPGPGAIAGIAAPGFGRDIAELPAAGIAAPGLTLVGPAPAGPADRSDALEALRTEVESRSIDIRPDSLLTPAWPPGVEDAALPVTPRPAEPARCSPSVALSSAGPA